MAIRRCPYCKAIIDEQDKYCNNCGTQLLFPEDEFVEEEIPGDKILDKDEPEPAETEDTGEEREPAAGIEDEEEPADEDDDENEDENEAEDEDDEEDEDADVEDLEDDGKDDDLKTEDEQDDENEAAGEPDDEADDDDHEDDEDEDEDDLEDEDESEDLDRSGAAVTGGDQLEETASSAELEEEPDEEEEAAEDDDLNGLVEVGRAEDAPGEPDKKYEVSIEDDELVIKTKAIPDTASLPPWANRIRETPPTVGSEEGTRGTSPLSREWTTDSGIGIPERVTQAALPFSDTGTQEIRPPAQETDHVEEETREATAEVEEAGPAGGLSLKLRAKFVDWVFVTALWVISLWFTAQVVGVSFFRLLFGSPLQVLAFYLILLVLYFFLFLYFLGETLGDHYFSE